jgi:hypothetical protein
MLNVSNTVVAASLLFLFQSAAVPPALGLEFLLPGSSVSVDVDDRNGNCRVDVKTVLDNGSNLVYRRVNACQAEGHAVLTR